MDDYFRNQWILSPEYATSGSDIDFHDSVMFIDSLRWYNIDSIRKVLTMSKTLEKAFKEASQLPKKDQEEFAAFLLVELDSEQRWQTLLSSSASTLELLAQEAKQEHKAGETQPFNVKGV